MKESAILARLRPMCLGLPEVRETVKWGHPTFEAGKKIFAVLDRYEGRPCLAFRAPLEKVDELLTDSRFTEAPYAARFGWVCLDVSEQIDWAEVERLVADSYRPSWPSNACWRCLPPANLRRRPRCRGFRRKDRSAPANRGLACGES
jgi:predicted DNA-binding protein (MmcQ/YjbR family)